MRPFLRPALLVAAILLVPIVPFVLWGDRLEAHVTSWLEPPPPPQTVALLTAAVLASDILMPVPSSFVSTWAGAQLGVPLATAASWLGLTAGAVLGFTLARLWGRPVALRFTGTDDLERMEVLSGRYGPAILAITRPLPALAEAAVLLLGVTRLSWRSFLPVVMLSNLGLALVYSAFGRWAQSEGQLPLALAASVALPLVAATIVRKRFAARRG